jgi:hypothetical protein
MGHEVGFIRFLYPIADGDFQRSIGSVFRRWLFRPLRRWR